MSSQSTDETYDNVLVLKELNLVCKLRRGLLEKAFHAVRSGHWDLQIIPVDVVYGLITRRYDRNDGKHKYALNDQFKIQLFLNETPLNEVFALFSFSVEQNGREVYGKSGCSMFSKMKLASEAYTIPLRDLIENEEFQLSVTVHAEINYYKKTPKQTKEISISENTRDLLSSLQKGECSDVVIKVDGKEIKCHRCILSCRSSYFSAMFKSGLSESVNNQIEITDFDYETIKAMINFLYVFECPKLPAASSMSLLEAAHKYRITDLKDICEDRVISNISASNVLDVLLHADTYSADRVNKRAMDFIWKNSACFKKAEQYEPLISRPYLLRDLLLAKINEGDAR